MTYCGSTWVSEWGWSKVLPWIQTMSTWELSGAAGGPATKQTLLHGRVAADGTTDWFVADGWFDPTLASTEHTVRISSGAGDAAGTLVDAPAMWREFERTEDWSVVAPIPADTLAAWNAIDRLTLVTPDRTIAIDKSSVAVVGSAATRLQAP